ncbi:hypothetical protein BVIET440_60244 [Burkholderia vietnamiensis]
MHGLRLCRRPIWQRRCQVATFRPWVDTWRSRQRGSVGRILEFIPHHKEVTNIDCESGSSEQYRH